MTFFWPLHATEGAFIVFENLARFSPLSDVVLKCAMINITVSAIGEQENIRQEAMANNVEIYNQRLVMWILFVKAWDSTPLPVAVY